MTGNRPIEGSGFHVDLDRLEQASSGVRASVAEQSNTPLRDVAVGGSAFGHQRIADAVTTFCIRWSGGLDLLIDDAATIGDTLSRAVASYRDADTAAARAFDPADPALPVVADG